MSYFTKPAAVSATFVRSFAAEGNWVFYVDDGGDDLVESSEAPQDDSGTIQVRRVGPLTSPPSLPPATELLNISSLRSAGVNLTYLGPSGFPRTYNGISDHWHVFAHGYHWIAFSLLHITGGAGSPERREGVGVGLVQFTIGLRALSRGVAPRRRGGGDPAAGHLVADQ